MSKPSTITNTIVATTRINQKRFASWLATGPVGFKIEGEFSPHAARRIEDISIAERTIPQRLILCRGSLLESGILTVLTLWAIGLVQGFQKDGSFPLALATFIVGLIVAIVGLYQEQWLVGSAHWVIQVIHLLLGLTAIGLGEMIVAHSKRRLKATMSAS